MTADRGQTISRPSCLTVTVTRLFRRLATTSAALFPQSENISYFRDIKPFSACLCFYSTTSPLCLQSMLPLVKHKKQQLLLTIQQLKVTFSYLSAFGCWESGFVCQRRAVILRECKGTSFNKISARPRGSRPLTDCALLSRFGCAERYAFVRKRYPPLGFSMDFLRLALLLFRKEKCYAFGKKCTEDQQKMKTAAVYARYSSDN